MGGRVGNMVALQVGFRVMGYKLEEERAIWQVVELPGGVRGTRVGGIEGYMAGA